MYCFEEYTVNPTSYYFSQQYVLNQNKDIPWIFD
jgi:hypothetical protein